VRGLGFLLAVPEKVLCEAVRVKPKLQWRPQGVGYGKGLGHLRKATGNEWCQFKRGAIWTSNGKSIKAGAHITPHALNAGHEDIAFGVFLAVFLSCVKLIFHCFSVNPPFWNGNVYSAPLYIVINLLMIFIGLTAKNCLKLFEFRLLNNTRTANDSGLLIPSSCVGKVND
jgi:hypothetical protein